MEKQHFILSNTKKEETTNVRALIDHYLIHWKWIALCIVLALGISFVYLRYTIPVYESQATVLIKEDKTNIPDALSVLDLDFNGGGGSIDNEKEIFKSRSLLSGVARRLRLNWSCQIVGDHSGIVRGELYETAPLELESARADSMLFGASAVFEIEILNNDYFLLGTSETKHRFGAVVPSSIGKVIIRKTPSFSSNWHEKKLRFTLTKMDQVISGLQRNLTVEPVNKESDVLRLSFKGTNIERNNAILDELISQHDRITIENKNEIASNTSAFINERMNFIALELSDVERKGEQYKSENKLVDVTSDAAMYLSKESQLEQEVTESSIQMRLAEFMNDYIRKQSGYENLLPANLGFKDAAITNMVNQYNTLVLERNRLREINGDRNPGVQKTEAQLGNLKSSLIEGLRNLKTSQEMQLNTLKTQENIYRSKISSIPHFEREYRDIQRQQQIKETLYLFLLQKREENEITLASTVGNTQLVDSAYSNGIPVSPKKSLIYVIAFTLGLFIPLSIIYLIKLLDNRVRGRKDLEALPLPVVCELPRNHEENYVIAKDNAVSAIAEAFRTLRTNMHFLLRKKDNAAKVIFVTSTISGEGKTFTSLNLAHTLANSGVKVVLVGLDLRKPKIQEYLNINNAEGVSNFIVNEELSLQDVIVRDPNHEHLDYVLSGHIPPNPSELLLRSRLDDLFNELKTMYDYIIVDTAPVGLVSDTLDAIRLSDLTLYVVRAGYLDKRALQVPQLLYNENKLKTVSFVVNGVKHSKGGYGYSYGYSYGSEPEKKGVFRRLFPKK